MAKESSAHTSVCHGGDQSSEESGWTIYFEDFLNNHHPTNQPPTSFSSFPLSPDQSYPVADAASSVVDHKLLENHDGAAMDPGFSCKDHINLFKKRKMIYELLVHERRETGDLIGIGSEYTELKKRGLCLVPFSMILNYMDQ
ncbi:hypothetical protein SDJN02_13722, partial [Cucurbita argyrosperma subsp. argyrosperma]